MAIMIGSARCDERSKSIGGKKGDQKQKTTNDTVGEVSLQRFYTHGKGWWVIRPKKVKHAKAIAKLMKAACNNKNIGYDQGNRIGILIDGIYSKTKTECDCSSLVRECIKEATGKDPKDFTTASEVSSLMTTGLFKDPIQFRTTTKVYNGDILVTRTKGHTAIVVSGRARKLV